MIIVHIIMKVLPEKQKEVIQTLLSMKGPMKKQKGCRDFSLLCDTQDHNLLSVFEVWKNRDNLDLHFKSEIFGVLLGVKSLLVQPHDIQIHTLRQTEGMSAVRTVREKKQAIHTTGGH